MRGRTDLSSRAPRTWIQLHPAPIWRCDRPKTHTRSRPPRQSPVDRSAPLGAAAWSPPRRLKVRRQVAIGPYIADFVCLERRLIFEADSPLHDDARDAARDDWLIRQGFRVLRLPNDRINEQPALAMDDIRKALGETPHNQGPLAE